MQQYVNSLTKFDATNQILKVSFWAEFYSNSSVTVRREIQAIDEPFRSARDPFQRSIQRDRQSVAKAGST